MQYGFDDHGPPPKVYADWSGEAPVVATGSPSGRVDVAIVGGGITGLSAALHLAPTGARVVVLEAKEVGWGASGRAFGQIVPTLKHGTARLIDHVGPARGARLIDDVAEGPKLVFELIERHGIDCGLVRNGLLFAARTRSGLRALQDYAADWQQRGADVEILGASATKAVLGTDVYSGACIDRRGGHLNPLAFTRGLARASTKVGARIYVDSRVERIERRAGVWHLGVSGRSLVADSVILATNAYTGSLWPDIARSIVPMRVHGALTAPMPAAAMAGLLPQGHPLTDTRRLYSGVRRVPGGRFHVTVDGPAFGRHDLPYLDTADRRLKALYPNLPRPLWEETWNGWIALTKDQMPRLHILGPGLFAGFGYSGRGLAAATMMGRDLARLVGGADERDITFPISATAPIRGHAWAPRGIATLIQGWRMLDRLDGMRNARFR